ncbi:hypothetical protein AAF712_002804, partial [Marasmius tenuissimus]
DYQPSRGFDPKTINFARHLKREYIFQPSGTDRLEEVIEERKCNNGFSEYNVNANLEDPSNAQDQQPVGDAGSSSNLRIRGALCDREDGFTTRADIVDKNTQHGELESGAGDHPDKDLIHRKAINSDMAADSLRPRSSESTSGHSNGADRIAGSTPDTAPRIYSEVNSTVTPSHEVNTQNIGGLRILHASPCGDTYSEVHGDGTLRRQIRTSRIRTFVPPTSLTTRVLATPRPSPITVEVLSESYAPPSNNTATLRSFLPGDAPTNPRRNQRHLVRMEDSSRERGGALPS